MMLVEPDDLMEARVSLQCELPGTMSVGSAYGVRDIEHLPEGPQWHLLVFTDDEDVRMVPERWRTFEVFIQGIPVAQGG